MSSLGLRKAARIKAIHAACRSAGIDSDERHRLQKSLTGKESLNDMSYAEVNTVLDHLNRGSAIPATPARPRASRTTSNCRRSRRCSPT